MAEIPLETIDHAAAAFVAKAGPYPSRRRDFTGRFQAALPALYDGTATVIYPQHNAGPLHGGRRVDHALTPPVNPSMNAGPALAYGGREIEYHQFGTLALTAESVINGTPPYFFEWVTDDPTPEVLSYSNGGMLCRVLIDGKLANGGAKIEPTVTTGGSYQRLAILNGPATTVSTTIVSGGATSIDLAAAPAVGDIIAINPMWEAGGTLETAEVSAVSGSGPYTCTLKWALWYGHTSGQTVYICTRKLRHYKLFGGWPVRAIGIDAASTVYPPSKVSTRVGVLMDSYGTANDLDAIPLILGHALGWAPLINALGGSGFVAGGPGSAPYTAPSRVDALLTAPLEKLVLWGSVNDMGQTEGAVQAAVAAVLTKALLVLDAADIFVTGPPTPSDSSVGGLTIVNTGMAAACDAAGVTFIDQITDRWVTGSGKTTVRANNGNADLITGPDGVHPSVYGSQFYGLRVASAIADAWAA